MKVALDPREVRALIPDEDAAADAIFMEFEKGERAFALAVAPLRRMINPK